MLNKGVFFKAVKAAAFALAVCGLASGCGGGDKDNPAANDPPPGSQVDNNLVGDWLVFDGGNKKEYITLKPSGELSEGALQRAGDVWIEGRKEGTATWGVSRSRGEFYVTSAIWRDTVRYELSGGVFTTTACYGNSGSNPVCRASALTRIGSLADFKSALGTVYANDRGLYVSAAHRDLMWKLQSDANEIIDFDAIYFNKQGGRYGIAAADGLWYTTGDSKLVLMDAVYDCGYGTDDCGATVLSKVELDYGVTTGAAGAPVRLTLSGGGSAEDAWLPDSYDDRGGYGAAKARRGGSGVGKHAVSPLARVTGRR